MHAIGTYWCALLWDMRELLIMKDPNGVFFDGARRLGNGTSFYIGSRRVNFSRSRNSASTIPQSSPIAAIKVALRE